MKRIYISLIALLLPLFLFAGPLQPNQKASLYQHLKEVNPYIQFYAEEAGILATEVSFKDDTERIQAHLAFVQLTLSQNPPADLSPEAQQRREKALEDLASYWKNGVFPTNTGHPARQPYFIDHEGVACAVGQLMVENGGIEAAKSIREEQNFGFIRQLKDQYSEVGAWASANGFSADELAWIQPAYPPQQDWRPMGYGTNGVVNLVFPDPSGNKVVIAGTFTEADSQSHNMVTAWNGNTYESLGNGVSGVIHDGLSFGGGIWLYGSFSNPGGGNATIARYDGNTWAYADPFPGMSAVITTANVFGDSIVFAGSYDAFGQVDYLASFKNENYRQLAMVNRNNWKIDGPIEDVEWFNGNFYICGDIKENTSPGFPPVHVLQLSGGSFVKAGNGMDNVVYDMAVVDGELLVGGEFFNDQDQPTRGLAAFDGNDWQGLLDVTQHHDPGDTLSGQIYDIYIRDNLVTLSGNIQTNPFIIGNYGSYLLRYQRVNDSTVDLSGLALLNGTNHSICNVGGDYYIGGAFDRAGFFSSPVNYVSYWENLANLIDEPKEIRTLASYPNPASSETFVSFQDASEEMDVLVFDLNGKRVAAEIETRHNGFQIHRSQLNDGLYIYQITGEQGLIATGKVWFY